MTTAANQGVYLEFADYGVATAYVNLAFGVFADEAAYIAGLNIDARVLHLIGQSDLAVSMAVEEFRKLLDAPYPSRDSHAFSLNWNFAVPYVFGESEDPSRWKANVATGNGGEHASLSFFQHLRLRRAVFAYPDAEGDVVRTLRRLLADHGIDAAILAGLGWSDIIIDGHVRVEQMPDFTRFVMRAHELHLPLQGVATGKLPVFQRMLTLFGYTPGAVPRASGLRHLTFVRTVPGRLEQARAVLRDQFPAAAQERDPARSPQASADDIAPTYNISFIDGKSDFVLELAHQSPAPFLGSDSAQPPDDPLLFERQERLVRTDVDATIQRVESHILLTGIDDVVLDAAETAVWLKPRVAEHRDCTCAKHVFDLTTVRRPFEALPRGLRQAINNLLLLFTAALRDPTTCCDSFHAIEACQLSLLTLLQSLDNLLQRLPTTEPMTREQLKQLGLEEALRHLNKQTEDLERLQGLYPEGIHVNELLADRYKYFEDWHQYAERVLSQRIVGSFEAMLGHTDRVTTYRGGAQKFLHLADALVRDFTLLIPNVDGLAFTTLYDSVDTIMAMRGGHFIRIPVRHVFTLPLGVADLWHEVGVAICNLRYDAEAVAQIAAKIHYNADVLSENLGDTYGDFIVFLFGFRHNFVRFADSIIKGWRDSKIPGGIVNPHEVLTRLYLVLELALARRAKKRPTDQLLSKEWVVQLVWFLRGFVISHCTKDDKDSLRADEIKIWNEVAARVTHPDFLEFRARMTDFLDAAVLLPRSPGLKEILKGRTIDLGFDADINALFADYTAMANAPGFLAKLKRAKSSAKKQLMFRSMAALTKSAIQAYMRRFATPGMSPR